MIFIFSKIRILFISFIIFIVACSAEPNFTNEYELRQQDKKESEYDNKISLYMTDAEDSGQVIVNNNNAKYYRKIIKNELGKRFLVQDFYMSGQKLSSPYWLVDGQKDYVFNESMHKGSYPREGERILWYESGSKMAVTNYANNIENGLWESWYENGNLKDKMIYKNGQLDGVVKNWNTDGVLVGECHYMLGKENGRCYEKYTINPDIFIYDGQYKNGQKIGLWNEWDLEGNLTNSERFN
jgi:antitoxin component YwqK of YwqJK toxin-antitoxin module